MEEAPGSHVYSHWNEVKCIFLQHTKDHCIVFRIEQIFIPDEYQADAGNLCYNQLIVAVDKSTMNGDTENYLQAFICTLALEVVKANEYIERRLANGLLGSLGNVS